MINAGCSFLILSYLFTNLTYGALLERRYNIEEPGFSYILCDRTLIWCVEIGGRETRSLEIHKNKHNEGPATVAEWLGPAPFLPVCHRSMLASVPSKTHFSVDSTLTISIRSSTIDRMKIDTLLNQVIGLCCQIAHLISISRLPRKDPIVYRRASGAEYWSRSLGCPGPKRDKPKKDFTSPYFSKL